MSRDYPTQEAILNDIVDFSIFDIRIIVAGTRGFNDYGYFFKCMKESIANLKGNIIFYTGLAKSGADKLIVDFCEKEGYLYRPFPADWDRYKKSAGYIRNQEMADSANWLIAFWDQKSPGTKHMIDISHQKDLRIKVFDISKVKEKDVTRLFTVQMSNWRLTNSIATKLVDITAKSGIEAFAPDYSKVMEYKSGKLSEEEYTKLYLEKMKDSQSKNPKIWKTLLKYDSMAFACYCKVGNFCHRKLFIKLAKEYIESNGKSTIEVGELTKELLDSINNQIANSV